MRKITLYLMGIFFILTLSSCGTNNNLETVNSKLNQELLSLKAENNTLKQEIETLTQKSNIDTIQNIEMVTEKTLDISENDEPESSETLKENIKLAGCEQTKKVGNVEWCMKNSELIKEVDGYETRFSKSVQNDSGFKGIYETDNEDKLYTFEYLQKACGIIEGEGIITDNNMKKTCPCPTGYHIPTTKEWRDTSLFYKENVNLFKSELGFSKNAWNRSSNGNIVNNIQWINKYHTSNLATSNDESYIIKITQKEVYIPEGILGDSIYNAYPIRCVKNN